MTTKQTVEKPVRVLKPYNSGVTADKAFQLAKSEGLIIISNKRADDLLKTDEWKSVREVWPIHTGTMTAFTKPGAKLGATVEYADFGSGLNWVFEVPTGMGLRSLKNVLLAVEHPHYDIEVDEKKRRVIVTPQKELIVPVENFPQEDGWYEADTRTAVPVNVKLDSENRNARHLWRIDHRVGLLIRGSNYLCSDYYGRRSVLASNSPSNALGVLVEQEMTLETAIKLVEKLQGKLKLAEGMATDARPKLEKLREVVKPESLEELTELIKLLTGREK